jgi:caa(3)-type oxidase subunit IV
MSRKIRIALGAWAALLLLLGGQLGLWLLPAGSWHLPAALAVAGAMAAIVAYAFMELAEAPKLARIFAYAGVGWMMILFCLGGADYVTRVTSFVAEPFRQLAP